jgi:regulator of protease activity HflC (stomatin/prohibitin superfamily)
MAVDPPSLDDIKARIKRAQGSRPSWTLLLVAVTSLILVFEFVTGGAGCTEIQPGEVAVIYNNTGLGIFGDRTRAVREQGALGYIPGIQSVVVLEAKPQILVMGEGGHAEDKRSLYSEGSVNMVDQLTVRASDGSNLYFDGLEVHYQINRDEPDRVILTSGPADGFKKNVVVTHVREILRDEFGRFSFLEIANPTNYGIATTEAKRRLNEQLEPYGITVTQIITPKPQFDDRVEKAIEERQNAEQEVEVQVEKRNKLEQEKQLKIQSVEQTKNAQYQTLVAELEASQKAADNKLISVKRDADKYFIDREATGGAYRDEKVTRAKANEEAYRKDAQALVAKINAVGNQGPDVLNAAIAQHVFPQLKNVSGTPLSRPSSPIDIRYSNIPAAQGGGE